MDPRLMLNQEQTLDIALDALVYNQDKKKTCNYAEEYVVAYIMENYKIESVEEITTTLLKMINERQIEILAKAGMIETYIDESGNLTYSSLT